MNAALHVPTKYFCVGLFWYQNAAWLLSCGCAPAFIDSFSISALGIVAGSLSESQRV